MSEAVEIVKEAAKRLPPFGFWLGLFLIGVLLAVAFAVSTAMGSELNALWALPAVALGFGIVGMLSAKSKTRAEIARRRNAALNVFFGFDRSEFVAIGELYNASVPVELAANDLTMTRLSNKGIKTGSETVALLEWYEEAVAPSTGRRMWSLSPAFRAYIASHEAEFADAYERATGNSWVRAGAAGKRGSAE